MGHGDAGARRERGGRLLPLLVMLALLAGCTSAVQPTGTVAVADEPALAVTGYIESGTSSARVAASAAALTTVGIDGVNLNARGSMVTRPDADTRALLEDAHDRGLRAELLVGNYSTRLDDFDTRAAHRLLVSQPKRAAVIARLTTVVADQGWDGVQIDLEALRGVDATRLVHFLRDLRAALPASASLSMAVSAYESRAEMRANGYRLAPLGRVLDRVVLMAYGQHGPTWTAAGPIGGLPWCRDVLAVLLADVPAAKVDLGVAGYGYTWPRHGTGRSVTDAQARRLAARDGAEARWDETQGEWTAVLSDGTVLWWSDHRSWTVRRTLATESGVHGMALWSLGTSDPLTA